MLDIKSLRELFNQKYGEEIPCAELTMNFMDYGFLNSHKTNLNIEELKVMFKNINNFMKNNKDSLIIHEALKINNIRKDIIFDYNNFFSTFKYDNVYYNLTLDDGIWRNIKNLLNKNKYPTKEIVTTLEIDEKIYECFINQELNKNYVNDIVIFDILYQYTKWNLEQNLYEKNKTLQKVLISNPVYAKILVHYIFREKNISIDTKKIVFESLLNAKQIRFDDCFYYESNFPVNVISIAENLLDEFGEILYEKETQYNQAILGLLATINPSGIYIKFLDGKSEFLEKYISLKEKLFNILTKEEKTKNKIILSYINNEKLFSERSIYWKHRRTLDNKLVLFTLKNNLNGHIDPSADFSQIEAYPEISIHDNKISFHFMNVFNKLNLSNEQIEKYKEGFIFLLNKCFEDLSITYIQDDNINNFPPMYLTNKDKYTNKFYRKDFVVVINNVNTAKTNIVKSKCLVMENIMNDIFYNFFEEEIKRFEYSKMIFENRAYGDVELINKISNLKRNSINDVIKLNFTRVINNIKKIMREFELTEQLKEIDLQDNKYTIQPRVRRNKI